MRKLCGNYAEIMRLLCGNYAEIMRLLCGYYEHLMRKLCGNYAEIMRKLCGNYAEIMRKLCGYYEHLMRKLCGNYAEIMRKIMRIMRKIMRKLCGNYADYAYVYYPHNPHNYAPPTLLMPVGPACCPALSAVSALCRGSAWQRPAALAAASMPPCSTVQHQRLACASVARARMTALPGCRLR